MTISGRAYRHTATHYEYSCSVDWPSVPIAKDGEKGPAGAGDCLVALMPRKLQSRYKENLAGAHEDTVFSRISLLAGWQSAMDGDVTFTNVRKCHKRLTEAMINV